MSGLVENSNTGIFSDIINVTNVSLCMVALLIELYLSMPFSVTLTFQGHGSLTEYFMFLSNEVETFGDCEVHQMDYEYTIIFDFRTYLREIIDMFSNLRKL